MVFAMATLDFPVDWSDGYQVTYEFKTDMTVSRSGREQRRALRMTPRKSLEYRTVLTRTELQRFDRLLSRSHHQVMSTYEVTRFTFMPNGMPAISDEVDVSSVPDWLIVGAKVVLSFERTADVREVAEIVGSLVRFTSIGVTSWPAGTKIHPVLQGNVARQIRAPHKTNTTAVATISFDVEPASEPVIKYLEDPEMFHDREVFLLKPNWINDINWTYEHEIETVDYGRGRIAKFMPIQFETNLFEAGYLARNSIEAENLRRFFERMMGQAGEFYMPTWTEDMAIRSTAFAGTDTLRIAGPETFEVYEEDTVHRSVAVFLRDGRRAFGRIRGMYALTDVIGHDTILEMEDVWPFDISPANVLMICWMPVWRFATDTLTLEWVTDTVAQTKLSLKTLEALPVDIPPIIEKRYKFAGRGKLNSQWRYIFPQNFFAPFTADGTFDAVSFMQDDRTVQWTSAGSFDAYIEYSVTLTFEGSGALAGTPLYQFESQPSFSAHGAFDGAQTSYVDSTVPFVTKGTFTVTSANFVYGVPAALFQTREDELNTRTNTVMPSEY